MTDKPVSDFVASCLLLERVTFNPRWAADEIERLREWQRRAANLLPLVPRVAGSDLACEVALLMAIERTAIQPDDAIERTGIEFLHLWMRTPNPMLGNVSPLDMMDSGRGERLADFIRDAADADGITDPTSGAT